MADTKNIIAIVGSYRKRGIVDQTIDEILAAAKEAGAETRKIYLTDKQLSYCTNCRSCTQQQGLQHGKCVQKDDMENLLQNIENSDAIILGSPMNAGTVTAVMKTFIERLIMFSYWPWGQPAPKNRNPDKKKTALLVGSSAAPAFMAKVSGDVVRLLKTAARLLGAKPVGTLFIGLAAGQQHQKISERTRKKARTLGKKLVMDM
ncbi:MAG: flavodoxin family protein [Chlorobiaceae bacterium]